MCHSFVLSEYVHPLSSAMILLKHFLCPKICFPGKTTDDKELKIFRKPCCFDECNRCRAFLQSANCILQCPQIFDEDLRYQWKEYGAVLLDNGNEIKELKIVSGGMEEFKNKFKDLLRQYKKHYFKYKWLNFCRKVDIVNLDSKTIFIQTDYSAQPTLDSQDKLNSVGHGVCVLSCWVVLHSPRRETYMHEGELKEYTFYECDHIRVVTPSTGKHKDQDWFMHCRTFEFLLEKFKNRIPDLENVIVWTDGAPNQYKCRQNFYWLSTVKERFNLNIVHRFGATAQFKGVHDKIGQVAKWTVK